MTRDTPESTEPSDEPTRPRGEMVLDPDATTEAVEDFLTDGGTTGPPASTGLLTSAIRFAKQAGAPSEDSYARDGFLSYHAESHALGLGLAAGWMATAHGEADLLGLVYGAAVYGKAQERDEKRRRILVDVVQEWHYALVGVVVGGLLGATVGQLVKLPGIEASDILDVALEVPHAV